MKVKFSSGFFATVCCLALFAHAGAAQNTIQLFSAVDLRDSLPTASYSFPNLFGTSTINLTCGASPTATLSGPLSATSLVPGGNLIVDNSLLVTVTPLNGVPGATTNVCTGGYYQGGAPGPGVGTPDDTNQNCFNLNGYGYPATAGFNPSLPVPNPGPLDGDDPDTYVVPSTGQTIAAGGGVAPIPIDSLLIAGTATQGQAQSVTIALADYGGGYFLTSSSIFLSTNCTLGGVSAGTVSGNTFTSNTATQTQSFTFNSNPGNANNPPQVVTLLYDVSKVPDAANGTTPNSTDAALDPSVFQSMYVPKTSFATSSCLIHTGEVLPGTTTPACKLYTLECIDPTTGLAAGINCPVSGFANEGVTDFFDGPQFSLQNIYTPYGVFHEGIGFLMSSDDWSPTNGGPCAFDTTDNTPVASQPCPQNLLVSFSGPGGFTGVGLTTNPNSTFISIAGVPEDSTSVLVAGEWPDNWVSNKSPKIYFSSQAPNLSKGASVLNSKNKLVPLTTASSYVPAPIKSITYGISAANNPNPPLPTNEPITDDNTIMNTATTCPVTLPTSPTEPNFATGAVSLQFPNGGPTAPLADGKYLLHYFAQDCAGTQELQFNLNNDPNNNNAPTWSTTFYTVPINIDTTPPAVTTPTLSPAGPYKVGQTVTATYSCSDAPSGSGVVLCGLNIYAPETKYSVGPLTMKFTANASHSFTVYAIDGAGNVSSGTATYTTH